MSPTATPRRGTLYVVATPIGNLEDLSPRATAVLASADLIACEDTRVTRALAARHAVTTRRVSYHRFNEAESAAHLLEVLGRGGSVALVTDGGTPGISDPGALLVRRAREEGHRVVPVPGPSALTTLLSASGFPSGPFTFVGFLPHRRGERRRILEALRREPRPLVVFESPRRLLATLEDARAILGDRETALGREMTKVHEELLSGRLSSIIAAFAGRDVKGEIAFMIAGADAASVSEAATAPAPAESPAEAVGRLVAAGWDRKEAMRRVARERGLSRRQVYHDLLGGRRDKE